MHKQSARKKVIVKEPGDVWQLKLPNGKLLGDATRKDLVEAAYLFGAFVAAMDREMDRKAKKVGRKAT